MSELAHVERRDLVVPGTGEVVSLDDLPAVARALRDVRKFKRLADEARAMLEEALFAESSRLGTKTLHLDELVASVGADTELSWDVTELVKLLAVGLPQERYGDLVTETVSYKVNAAVAKQIAGANPDYAEIIARAQVRVSKRRYVSVK